MIYVESKKKSRRTLEQLYPNAKIIDVTSKGDVPYVKLSPFYPHGHIPIPFSDGMYSETVEGIWQGLKVFDSEDIDPSKFTIKNMKGIKRTVRKFGIPLGHRKGVNGVELLDYITARKVIYLRAYASVLQTSAKAIIESLKEDAYKQDVVLLDFDTNDDIENPRRPLSHASLVKKHLEYRFPDLKTLSFLTSDVTDVSKTTEKITSVKKKPASKSKNKTTKKRSTDNQLSII